MLPIARLGLLILPLATSAPVKLRLLEESSSGCFDNDVAIENADAPFSSCAEAAAAGHCDKPQLAQACSCSCVSSPLSPPPPSPPSLPGWANGKETFDLSFGDDEMQKLDLYRTSAAVEGMPRVPCILYVHGGGWKGGDKKTTKNPPDWILYLRQRGYHVASTNYRLTPTKIGEQHQHPAQIEDVESAVLYLHEHHCAKVVAIGNSAGGHLVSLLGTRNYGPESALRDALAGVINFYGGAILYGEDSLAVKRLLGCHTPSDESTACYAKALDASPMTFVGADNAPHLIFHGEDDTVVPVNSSKSFQGALESAGVNSTLVIVPGVPHSKDLVACGQTGGLVNTEHIYRWIDATLSPGAPCDSIVCGGGTIYGDRPTFEEGPLQYFRKDLYNVTDAFVSPYCLEVRGGPPPDSAAEAIENDE